jgi:dihydrofolate reductase
MAMRKLIVCNLMSLDGYVEGDNKNFMVMPTDQSFDEYRAERLRHAATLLLGRATFELFHGFWPEVVNNPQATADQREISKRDNEILKIVVSDSLRLEPNAPWYDSTRVVSRADAPKVVADLKGQDGGDILTFGSQAMWSRLLKSGLIDELHLMIGPTVLGTGTPAFDTQVGITLRRKGIRTFEGSGNVVLQYEVQ